MRAVNLLEEVNEIESLYVYKKVGLLNSHVLSVVQVENRTLDFHIHEDSDELFYVIEGSFHLETEKKKIKVNAGEFIIVPKEVKHRPAVKELTKFLMIELAGTLNKENSGDLYEE
ncbi:cupin domain-containing protein [Marasmitruncus massiliensis]|uniref:cupin domain-containing protein n=1 Tax=Marasmitruncus massiliensis TaxID=1944642 RepID=UPI000C7A7A6A|nr:cupin domain-containing protein [Marasmitruncus massiliensis]